MRMPTLYLGHGAPPLLEDDEWMAQLRAWADALPRPKAILMISAHWEEAPVSLSALAPTPLYYDFYGFPAHYYQLQYPAPVATGLAKRVSGLLSDVTGVHQSDRGLDHGAYVPLMVMYPEADIPVIQMSLPTMNPAALLELGHKLAPLRDEGVLMIGSGFMTHGLPFITMESTTQKPPGWSKDFDLWATEAVLSKDLDLLSRYTELGPGSRYAHPSVEHFVPIFVAAGAAEDLRGGIVNDIDGYWYGLAKRSFTFQ